MTSVTFIMTVNVTDEAAVMAAAHKIMGFNPETDEPIGIATAVRYVLDHDTPEGLEVVDSTCEED